MASQEDLRKALSVEHFKIDPGDINAEKEYEFWKTKFELYVASLNTNDEQKLHILTNKLNARIYGYIDGLKDYWGRQTELYQNNYVFSSGTGTI